MIPGGGRINHNPSKNQIEIYGYSNSFGKADHKTTQKFLQEAYPDYEVSWKNQGY